MSWKEKEFRAIEACLVSPKERGPGAVYDRVQELLLEVKRLRSDVMEPVVSPDVPLRARLVIVHGDTREAFHYGKLSDPIQPGDSVTLTWERPGFDLSEPGAPGNDDDRYDGLSCERCGVEPAATCECDGPEPAQNPEPVPSGQLSDADRLLEYQKVAEEAIRRMLEKASEVTGVPVEMLQASGPTSAEAVQPTEKLSYHGQRLAERMEDPEFREAYEAERLKHDYLTRTAPTRTEADKQGEDPLVKARRALTPDPPSP